MELIIKGFIIGIGKIIPGVSGSMLAITLGIYEQILKRISNIKEEIKNRSTYLIKVGIGIILAITLTSKIIVKCLNMYYLSTMLLFIGLIIGGIPNLLNETKINKKDIIKIMTTLIILTTLLTITTIYKKNNTIEYSIIEFIKITGIGVLDALSSIIPGISGTAILMMLGYYDTIITSFSTLLNPIYLKKNIFIMIPFLLGFILGTVIISKIITYLFKKNKKEMNLIIITFTISSIIILIKNLNSNMIEIIKNTPLLILGYIISRKLEKKEHILN